MKWKDINKNNEFSDGSKVIQKHQVHDMECYEIEFDDGKTFTASKDHLIKLDISQLPDEAQAVIRKECIGKIPRTENIEIHILQRLSEEKQELIRKFIIGDIDNSFFEAVDEISEPHFEAYVFSFKDKVNAEVFVNRTPSSYDEQKIDENHYWVPLEGIFWLFSTYGTFDLKG